MSDKTLEAETRKTGKNRVKQLRHQGKAFVDRFDANSYLYMTRAMDYFDVTESFPKAIKFNSDINKHINYLVISFTSDWLFPTKENLQIVKILNKFGSCRSVI